MRQTLKLPKKIAKREGGIALFLVLSTLAVVIVVVAQLSYSTQVQARIAYNYIDGLKAYYNAKSAYKIGLLRLSMYKQLKDFLKKDENKAIKGVIGDNFVDKVWNFPFMYPIPVTEDNSMVQKDEIAKFNKESNLEGTFQLEINSEGSKINLNNLLVKVAPTEESPQAKPSPGASASPTPSPSASASPTEVDIRETVENTIDQALRDRNESDREFNETYRGITGKDIVDAIVYYMKPLSEAAPRPNLPGFSDLIPKEAPMYSLSELHFIPGIDDTIYGMIEPQFTVFHTPGVNINTASKGAIRGILPGIQNDELNELMAKRDDPEQGKPFDSEDKFWEAVKSTSLGGQIDQLKEKLKKAGIKLITSEESFKISVTSKVGLAIRHIDAWVIFDRGDRQNQPTGNAAQQKNNSQPISQKDAQSTSPNQQKLLRLIYWRSY